MFNSCGVKIKKTYITSKVGFERKMNSCEWSKVKAIHKIRKVSDTETAALAETLPGYENLISIKGIGMFSAATFLVTIGNIGDFPKFGNLANYGAYIHE